MTGSASLCAPTRNGARCSNLVPGLSGMATLDLGQRIDAERVVDAALTAWAGIQSASAAAEALKKAGIPAAALARTAIW